jgi:uncharacterized RDD family membrane protein YckC
MNASEEDTCKRCGTVVLTKSTEKLCPACLISGALAGSGDETRSGAPGQSTSPGEPTEYPREFGGYRLLGLLGRGGMGTVYESEELTTGRRLALKMLGQELDSPDMRQRFLREGRLAARVNHPNSLFIYGSEEIEGLPVITMEIAGSGTLKDKLKQRGPLPVAEAVDAVLDVISGLESAFAGGVLHRDVKPSNCFVCPDGSVKVGDFGLSVSTLAKADTFVTAHGKIMGTPAYASPEQLRGDALDVRADIYSVGATLFTLLTDRAPFEGDNAVQVVANAISQEPASLTELREDLPPGLERVVSRCLAKEPAGRYADYPALRNALLPFSSREAEPASMLVRASAGWIDYLVAFLPPYVALMFLVGGEELLVRPVVEHTLISARYHIVFLGFGFLYFSVFEGIWGAGLGKWLKGLRVVRTNGRPPGLGRALVRILIPVLCFEGVRMPLTMALISDADWTGLQTALYVVAGVVCGWIPALLAMRARRENGFATVWDLASGTRVVVRPKGTVRPSVEPVAQPEIPTDGADSVGPYRITREVVPGAWIVGIDPVLRRQVWLLRRSASELPLARRTVARLGRQRWLQKVETAAGPWDAFEATPGVPFSSLVGDGQRVSWSTLRHWLHDLATELWAATGDGTLPAALSLDHVWVTAQANAVAASVESTSVPLHARPVLQNLEDGKFEKLSFLTGTLRGLLDRPAEISRGIRAGSLFMLPLYVWIAIFVGYFHDKPWTDPLKGLVILSALVVLGAALVQLLELPFRNTVGHFIFRLAVVNAQGEAAARSHLLVRWAIVWIPLLLPLSLVALLIGRTEGIALISTLVLLLLWGSAAVYAVVHPHRGLHDRMAGTWVVRR